MATNSRKRSHTLVEASAAANQLPTPTQEAQKTINIRANSPAYDKQQQLGLSDNGQLISSTSTLSKPSAKKSKKQKKSRSLTSALKPSPNAPSKAFYLITIAAIDKKLASLDKICAKQNPNNKFGVNSDNYAQAMSAFLPSIKEQLLQQPPPSRDSLTLAFNLLLYMGEHAYADFILGPKMCGFGDSEPEYEKMDLMMMEVIDLLVSDQKEQAVDDDHATTGTTTTTGDGAAARAPDDGNDLRWDPDTHGDVGEYKTGRPNKQQRSLLVKQKATWEGERLKQRRESRESSSGTDLLTVGLKQLKDDRDEIKDFGA